MWQQLKEIFLGKLIFLSKKEKALSGKQWKTILKHDAKYRLPDQSDAVAEVHYGKFSILP